MRPIVGRDERQRQGARLRTLRKSGQQRIGDDTKRSVAPGEKIRRKYLPAILSGPQNTASDLYRKDAKARRSERRERRRANGVGSVFRRRLRSKPIGSSGGNIDYSHNSCRRGWGR